MKYNRCMSAALISAILFGAVTPVAADELNDKLQNLQDQIDESRAKQQSWQEVINEIAGKLRTIQIELDEANRKLKAIQAEQSAVNLQIKQTEEEIKKAEAYLKQRQEILNKRVRSIYMYGQLSYLEVITGAKSFSDFANRLELLKRIIHSDFNLIIEIQKQKAVIEAKKLNLKNRKPVWMHWRRKHKRLKMKLLQKSTAAKIMDEARSEKEAAAQMEADLIAESNNVREMIQNRIRQQQSGGIDTPVVHGTGVFIWPCNGPITSPFGYRTHPIFGTTIYHAGIDIGVDYGTPIHAADGGTVIAAEWYGGYGNAVIIDHGNGLQSLYGHNSSLTVSVGETVSQGQIIAYAGSTGYSTGPHCHFEVRQNGEAVDPMGYL